MLLAPKNGRTIMKIAEIPLAFIKLVDSTRRDRGRAQLRTFLVAVVIAGKIEMEESGKPYAALTQGVSAA